MAAGFGSLAVDENRASTQQSSARICRVCGDKIGENEKGQVFVACNACSFPVCRPCYEYERSEGNQCCPQCNTRYKRLKGSPRIPGDEEDNSEQEDFDDEFQTKNRKDDSDGHENGDYNNQQWHHNDQAFSVGGSVAGKDLEGEKEMYGSAEWKERVEK